MDGSENDFNASKRPVSLSEPLVDTYWTCTSKQLIWHPATLVTTTKVGDNNMCTVIDQL